ncbi:hypothetical protein Tco_0784678 [Tanacetum coccineum]
MVPRAVLMKSGLVSINTARQNISKTAVSVNTARQVNTAHSKTTVNAARPMSYLSKAAISTGNPQVDLQDQRVIDSGCSRHMTWNISYLIDYEENLHNLLLLVAKTVNGEVQLQALVDGKKIIITESIVRRDLQLEDAEGVDCLPNATIFEQLTLMGHEKIS